ncbi:hypothetical protein DI272_05100 [Streptomyces sp. Act143]|nr:hypothetical protein DI272_05100 [Streptomyces sp. Act143]
MSRRRRRPSAGPWTRASTRAQLPARWPEWAELTAHLLGRPHPSDTDQFLVRDALLGSARYLMHSGRLQEARRVCVEFHDLWNVHFGADHLDTLAWAAARAEAEAEAAVGEYADARPLALDVLERRRRLLGDDHPDTLAGANGLAGTFGALGAHEEARRLYEDIFQRRRRVLGDDHPDTLVSANCLGTALSALSEYEAARRLLQDVLGHSRRTLGEDHPRTLVAAADLATVLTSLKAHEPSLDSHRGPPSGRHPEPAPQQRRSRAPARGRARPKPPCPR